MYTAESENTVIEFLLIYIRNIFTLTVLLSTDAYEWVPVNLGRATNPPIQGAKIYFRVALYYRKSEVEISVGLMVY